MHLLRHCLLISCFLFHVTLIMGQDESGEEKPIKYAPQYCHQFHFNCQVSKGHVCCRFPLPPEGHNPNNQRNRIAGVGVRIRPIRLPISRNGNEENENVNHHSGANISQKQQKPQQQLQTQPNQNEPPKRKSPLLNKRKPHLPTQPTKAPANNDNPSSQNALSIKNRFAGLNRRRPTHCLRQVVNCKQSPLHRCCQGQEENQPKVQEEVKVEDMEVKKSEIEVKNEGTFPTTIQEEAIPVKTVQQDLSKAKKPPVPTPDQPEIDPVAGWVSSVESIPIAPESPSDPPPSSETPPQPILAEPELAVPSVSVVHQKIPAECFTHTYDCQIDKEHMCCQYM